MLMLRSNGDVHWFGLSRQRLGPECFWHHFLISHISFLNFPFLVGNVRRRTTWVARERWLSQITRIIQIEFKITRNKAVLDNNQNNQNNHHNQNSNQSINNLNNHQKRRCTRLCWTIMLLRLKGWWRWISLKIPNNHPTETIINLVIIKREMCQPGFPVDLCVSPSHHHH